MSKLIKIVSTCLMLAVVAVGIWTVVNRQLVFDQLRVWQYQPSSAVEQLATRSTMTDSGKFHFYTAWPQLESADNFNQDCRRVEKASPIVGCYVSGKETIHIYDVTDPELDGIKEVTAAHEMLHVAWSRLSEQRRAELTKLLEAAYQRLADDKLAERMAYYERAQPGSRANELHSILGTEFADLGDELEAHYRTYFADRTALVKLHAQYNEKFTAAEAESEQLAASLAARKAEIEQLAAAYMASVEQFNQKVSSFNSRAENGGFTSQEQFASERSSLVNESTRLKNQQQTIEAKVAAYNADVEKLNALGEKIDRLNQSLDSTRAVE